MEITYRKTHSEPVSPYAGFRGTYVVYDVLLDGERIGEVFNFRATGAWKGGGYDNHSGYGHGHWAWCADTAPEGEYPTRAEAVADMATVRAARQAA